MARKEVVERRGTWVRGGSDRGAGRGGRQEEQDMEDMGMQSTGEEHMESLRTWGGGCGREEKDLEWRGTLGEEGHEDEDVEGTREEEVERRNMQEGDMGRRLL